MNKTFIMIGRVWAYITSIIYLLSIILIPLGVLNIIAANRLGQFSDGELTKEDVQGWSVYLIFTTRIGGVFALLGVHDVFNEAIGGSSFEAKLRELNKLYDDGLLTKAEYDLRRQKIMES